MSLLHSMAVQGEPQEQVHEVLDQIQQLIREQSGCRFHVSATRVLLNSEAGKFLVDVPLTRWRLSATDMQIDHIETLLPSSADMRRVADEGRPLDELLWTLAWHGSSGQLLDDCRRNDVVSFSRWPNLTRLPSDGITARVVALMTARPSSVVLASRLLGIPEEAVAQVYSAGMKAGYATPVNRVVEAPVLKPHKHRSLIGRLMDRLQGH